MIEHTKKDYIAYRLKRANESILEVITLLEAGYLNTAVNRIYYSCFYAVNALLLKNDIKAQTHAGVRQALGQHFIHTGIISNDLGKFYSRVFDKRQLSDYEDFIDFDEETVIDLYNVGKEFIAAIQELIHPRI